jgi:exopolyphosphatase/pppGpp-phosphohydrolase
VAEPEQPLPADRAAAFDLTGMHDEDFEDLVARLVRCGIDSTEIIETVGSRRAPIIPAAVGLRPL